MADLAKLIEAETPHLRRYARALTHDSQATNDLVQDCLVRALSRLHLWQAGTDLRAWLLTILHNQYVNEVARSARRGVPVPLHDAEASRPLLPHQDKRLELRDLDRALTALPAEQRAAVLLIRLEGMNYNTAANILDVPVGTVRSRLSRGSEQLRRLMGVGADEPARVARGV